MIDRVLIVGASGLLGVNLMYQYPLQNKLLLHENKREIKTKKFLKLQFDASSRKSIERAFKKNHPSIIINSAGITDIEKCNQNPDLANSINAKIAENLADVSKNLGIKFVQISTDHLFDGKQKFCTEETPPNPLNHYGSSKALAEELVSKSNPDALIIRCNFFGWGPNYRISFSDFIYNNLIAKKEIKLATDYYYTPLSTSVLIDTIYELIIKNANGIFNVVGTDRLSKYDFGNNLSRVFKLNRKLIRPVKWRDLKITTIRPNDLSLSDDKINNFLGKRLGDINHNLNELKIQYDSILYRKVKSL